MAINANAVECDCTKYPFKPNPPCYGKCVAKFTSNGRMDITKVKNIDPGVSIGIKVLSAQEDYKNINFNNISNKTDLEREVLRYFEFKAIKKGEIPKAPKE
ncbi:MAG: hypothetical protein KAU29_08130 [Gammaproteobacteria bacterium]|nr:hypothetical protein [Gammaproteobacteria bacterium]